MNAVIDGGAVTAEINVLERESGAPIRLESSYIFSSRAALQVSQVRIESPDYMVLLQGTL